MSLFLRFLRFQNPKKRDLLRFFCFVVGLYVFSNNDTHLRTARQTHEIRRDPMSFGRLGWSGPGRGHADCSL